MPLDWVINKNQKTEQLLHEAISNDNNDTGIKQAVENSIEKAISLLPTNIQNSSLYFVVEWNSNLSALTIVVTDDTKQKESAEVVTCSFSSKEGYAEKMQHWVRDYLTTSASFIQFSLVAVFSLGNRQKVILL